MRCFKTGLLAAALMLAALPAARADYQFSGSGNSGTLVSASETWQFNYDGGATVSDQLNDWGSPGVNAGYAAYGEPLAAYGMELTFTGGGSIDDPSITIGNGANCAGLNTGGSTFCNTVTLPSYVWLGTRTGRNTITFLAQTPDAGLDQGETYFVNVLFDGATPTDFTGRWLTTPPAVPEPASLALLASGLAGLAALGRRRAPGRARRRAR